MKKINLKRNFFSSEFESTKTAATIKNVTADTAVCNSSTTGYIWFTESAERAIGFTGRP